MTDLCEIPIGEPGRVFMSIILGRNRGLCATMDPEVRQSGSAYAILPANTSFARAQEFETGGLITNQSRAQWLKQRLTNYSIQRRSGIVLFQDVWAERGNFASRPLKNQILIRKDEVYVWEEFGGAQQPRIDYLMRSLRSFLIVGVLVTDPKVVEEIKNGAENLEEIAAAAIEAYVSAYDDESFVMWVR